MRRIAIYDLDKTLTRIATFTPFLVFAARRRCPPRLLMLPVWAAAMAGYKAGLLTRGRLKAFGLRLMAGRATPDDLVELGHAFAGHQMRRGGAMPAVVELLRDDFAAGHTVIMATAAFEFYAGSFAQHFGIPHVIGTKWDGQRIEGDNCYGTEKHRRVIAWLERHGLSPNDLHIRFVSDSFADAPLLDLADEAIFVSASPRKRRLAAARGWRAISGE